MIGTNQLLCYEFHIVQVYLKKYDLLYCPKIYHKSIIILLQWLVVFLSVRSIVAWVVECPLWKPNWFSFSMLWLSGKLNNLLYINFFFILWKVFKLVGFEMFNIISIISINLLIVYRESVNVIGYITRRLSADSQQL